MDELEAAIAALRHANEVMLGKRMTLRAAQEEVKLAQDVIDGASERLSHILQHLTGERS